MKTTFAGQIVLNNWFFKRLGNDPLDLIPVKFLGIRKDTQGTDQKKKFKK
jgi:hypothetical protein